MGFAATRNHNFAIFANKLRWSYNHSTSNQVQDCFHQYVGNTRPTFALIYCEILRDALNAVSIPQGCLTKNSLFLGAWSLSQPLLWLSYCYNSVWLNKIKGLETLGHSILESQRQTKLSVLTPNQNQVQMEWQRLNKFIVDGPKWIVDHIGHVITGPFPNTVCDIDNFPHYRAWSEVLLFPKTRWRPPSREIRDLYYVQ